mgnify:CR=1 FL=1
MDIDFQSLVDQLKVLLRRQPADNKLVKVPLQTNKNFKFQIPIKDSFNNSGGFDPTGKGSVGHVHQGIDLRAPGGTSVYPLAPGIVTAVKTDPKGGNTVNIKYYNDYSSYYAHLGTISVAVGDKVDYNTVVGTVGDSGNAKGFPHLHMQCYKSGSLIDPASILSLPKYTAYNPKKEKLWIDDKARQVATNYKINNKYAKVYRVFLLYKYACNL